MGTSKRKETAPPAPVHRRDGVVERIEIVQTMRKDGKAELKHPKHVTTFRPHLAQPKIQGRELQVIEGKRHARRPSAVAKQQGKRRITECEWADHYEMFSDWSEDDEEMPDEDELEDTGWCPGPLDRDLPPFRGKPPGPTNKDLTPDSARRQIMNELLDHKFKTMWSDFTKEHCRAWRDEHPDWRKDAREKSMMKFEKLVTPELFDAWIAIRARGAQYKKEIPIQNLFDRNKQQFDPLVFRAMTFNQYQWINRHTAFASRAEATAVDEEEEEGDAGENEGDGEEEEEGPARFTGRHVGGGRGPRREATGRGAWTSARGTRDVGGAVGGAAGAVDTYLTAEWDGEARGPAYGGRAAQATSSPARRRARRAGAALEGNDEGGGGRPRKSPRLAGDAASSGLDEARTAQAAACGRGATAAQADGRPRGKRRPGGRWGTRARRGETVTAGAERDRSRDASGRRRRA